MQRGQSVGHPRLGEGLCVCMRECECVYMEGREQVGQSVQGLCRGEEGNERFGEGVNVGV